MPAAASSIRDFPVHPTPVKKDVLLDEKTDVKKSTDSKIKITAKKVFDVFKEIYDFIYAKNPVTQKRQLWFIPTS
nr:hypothetical protein [Candidatus Anoxychlamydiales bacterium]